MRGPGDVIGLLDLRRGGRDRKGAAALLGREVVQGLQVVGRHADDLRPGFLEVANRFAEGVSFGGAARGEGLGEEIEDHGALLELVGEVELELLAADRAGGGEIGRLVADLERGSGGSGGDGGSDDGSEKKLAHGDLLASPVTRAGIAYN